MLKAAFLWRDTPLANKLHRKLGLYNQSSVSKSLAAESLLRATQALHKLCTTQLCILPFPTKDSRILLTYIAWAYSSAQFSPKIRRDGITNTMWEFVFISYVKDIFPSMSTSLQIKTKHNVWHRSIRKVKGVWQTDMQLQQLVRTTTDPFSLGCLDKLTPSHWLSRSSKHVFPQRSPLGSPRTQRPMLWTARQAEGPHGEEQEHARTLWGDCSNSGLVDLTPFSYTGHIDFSPSSWPKVGWHAAKGSMLVLNVRGWQWGLASPSLLKLR